MDAPSRTLLLLATILVVMTAATVSQAECTKTFTLRPSAEGVGLPALILDCDEPNVLAESDEAAAAACSAETDVALRADCEEVARRANAAYRKAKIRAALRRGDGESAVVDRYGASEEEIARLRRDGPAPPSATKVLTAEDAQP